MNSVDGNCVGTAGGTWTVDNLAVYDQLLLRNFSRNAATERTFYLLMLSRQEREVTEHWSGPENEGCWNGDFTTNVGAWIEVPHGEPQAVISNDGKHISLSYREYEGGPLIQMNLTAQ